MAVKTLEELIANAHAIIGDNTSDEALTLLDDISDTFNAKSGEDWKQKYEDNDKAWRERYKERFLSGNTDLDKGIDNDDDDGHEETKPLTYENLFKEG